MSRSIAKPPSEDLEAEDIHDVLSNRRRRLVMGVLQEEGQASVRELSERIGAIESGENPPPRKVKQSVYVSLLQTHLPKLDELGIVDYQSQGKTVSLSGGFDDIAVFMETVPKYGISWSEYYTALSFLGLLTLVGAEVGTPVLTAVPGEVWAGGFFLALLASGVYHTARQGSSIVHRLRNGR